MIDPDGMQSAIHLDHLAVDCVGDPFRIDRCAHQNKRLTPRPQQTKEEIRFHRSLVKLVKDDQAIRRIAAQEQTAEQKPFGENRQSVGALSASQS